MDADDMEGTDMNVTLEIILDLLPAYLSGEASPATRSLVEDYMKQDPELARRIRLQWENIAKGRAFRTPCGARAAVFKSHAKTSRLTEVAVWLRDILYGPLA